MYRAIPWKRHNKSLVCNKKLLDWQVEIEMQPGNGHACLVLLRALFVTTLNTPIVFKLFWPLIDEIIASICSRLDACSCSVGHGLMGQFLLKDLKCQILVREREQIQQSVAL